MKMAQLSRDSGVPVATIKFYLREGLLPPGARTEPNQADYDGTHVRRLKLIRAFVDVGGLSVASARRVLDALDSDLGLAETFEAAHGFVSPPATPAPDDTQLARVDALLADWHYLPANPGRHAAARAIAAFEGAGQTDDRGWFAKYASAALVAAEADLDEIETRTDRDAQVETMIVGTVLGDALFAAFRRVAQEHVTARRYGSAG